MITTDELRRWLNTITDPHIAIDDGGLALYALDAAGRETGPSIELGGVPAASD
ncbi:hypothetical protein MUG78_17730 [Gordonia alkaliphila]|uniref:hypothetical protein n=1 Tax=Gordonia alkaliphila TaxID=1053547 RepID=UPI001FF42997|nr:hypothetical protein [Gordonia alkaliphila]MCK0441242.1 hypothetical protein [Gordonia alkaliphila]